MRTGKDHEDVARPGDGAGELEAVQERLRDVVAELKSSRERLQSREAPVASPPAGPAPGQSPGPELRSVERELAAAREDLDRRRAEEERLRSRLAELESEHRRVLDDYVAAQEQSSHFTSLFVALSRLHGTLERREVLAAIQEVVVNMLGSEELAIFELGTEGRLRAVHALGVGASRLADVPAGEGAIGRAALGHAFVAGDAARPEDPDLSACVPLRAGSRVTGALAVWRLLGHKPSLADADRELLELLSAHAGAALYAAGLHERHGGGAA